MFVCSAQAIALWVAAQQLSTEVIHTVAVDGCTWAALQACVQLRSGGRISAESALSTPRGEIMRCLQAARKAARKAADAAAAAGRRLLDLAQRL